MLSAGVASRARGPSRAFETWLSAPNVVVLPVIRKLVIESKRLLPVIQRSGTGER